MQRWDYLFVTCAENGTWRQPQWVPRYVNGDELPHWQEGPAIWAFSNERGTEGWELVSVVVGHQPGGMIIDYRLVFKRPRLERSETRP